MPTSPFALIVHGTILDGEVTAYEILIISGIMW